MQEDTRHILFYSDLETFTQDKFKQSLLLQYTTQALFKLTNRKRIKYQFFDIISKSTQTLGTEGNYNSRKEKFKLNRNYSN